MAKLLEEYMITNLGPARQFLSVEIYHNENGTGIILGQKAYITTILKQFSMEHSHSVLTPMDPKIKMNLAENQGEKELEDITYYHAVM
jgi:hypothetical protein